MLKLIDEILDLAKVESRQVPLSQEPVSLAEVMLECQGMIDPQAVQRNIRMTFPNSTSRVLSWPTGLCEAGSH